MTTLEEPAVVKKIENCSLSQQQVCSRNPLIGIRTEITVKQSIEHSIIKQSMRGVVRLHEGDEKRDKPDIFADVAGRHLSIDVKRYTNTWARRGRIYLDREFYGHHRGEDTLTTFLRDSKRFLFIAFELKIAHEGSDERRLIFVPGKWLKREFERSAEIGIDINYIVERWESFGKNHTRLYDIDIWKLIEISENEEAWP